MCPCPRSVPGADKPARVAVTGGGHSPRLAVPGGHGPRTVSNPTACSPSATPVTMLSLDGLIEDILLVGGTQTGGLLSAEVLIDDITVSAILYSGGMLAADLVPTLDLLATISSGVTLSAAILIEDFLLDAAVFLGFGSPTPDIQTLSKWVVDRGTVDLSGSGPNGETDPVATNPVPGNGMYLDMVGTDPALSPTGDTNIGKIRSGQRFSFKAGKQYRLSFYYCAYIPFVTFSMLVSIGNSGQVVSPTSFSNHLDGLTPGPFVLGEIIWTQVADTVIDAPIIFDHQGWVVDDGYSYSGTTAGLLLDRVKLENLTAGEEMFYDDFDFENP